MPKDFKWSTAWGLWIRGHALAAEGAKLAINYYDKPCDNTIAELKKKGADFIDIRGDISNEADTKNIAAKTMEKYGKIDVLINCAAIFGDQQLLPFMHIPVDFWRKVMDVNITGHFLMCRTIMPEMAKQEERRCAQYRFNNLALSKAAAACLYYREGSAGRLYPLHCSRPALYRK